MIIVDYGAGNLTSVYNALKYLRIDSEISNNPKKIESADKIIFPGVGAAKAAMENLNKTGIGEALKTAAKKGTPILGICIGCQIILDTSDENGIAVGAVPCGSPGAQCLGGSPKVQCLSIIPGQTIKFKDEPNLKIPHIGWNQVNFTKEHPIFKGIPNNSNFYFVHSYHPNLSEEYIYGTTTYGSQTFPSLIGKDNVIAAQFHLEKSGDLGLKVLNAFAHAF
ncbi:MAG: imidazole glycerol phosphate synthase subunit HisH [Fibromonadales bacterium]|nr:imidazole glycerol phosphate synthase subunit HisH [Fibromonadales bacterium]